MNYDIVIGVEVHAELKTKTKMFSQASSAFGQAPNSQVGLVDFALPGSLPTVNQMAVKLATQAALALKMEIDPILRFDRKCYFYPDLAKGYQITQQYYPLGQKGRLKLTNKVVAITRLHIEEDTAKQVHTNAGSLLDFNRSGNPLIEIVSAPVLSSSAEAMEYVDELRLTLLYAGVSDAKMEEGSLRCDINVSLKEPGSAILGQKVEIKNLNSISNIGKALDFEINRQANLLANKQQVEAETRRFDEKTRETVAMRSKDEMVNYHYLVETNILPIHLTANWLKVVQAGLPTLLNDYRTDLLEAGLSLVNIQILLNNPALLAFYQQAQLLTTEKVTLANWLISDVLGYLNRQQLTLAETKLTPASLVSLLQLLKTNKISSNQARALLPDIMLGQDPAELLAKNPVNLISDEAELLSLIEKLVQANPGAVLDFQQGKERIVGFLVGKVMQETKGQANPNLTSQLVLQVLKAQLVD